MKISAQKNKNAGFAGMEIMLIVVVIVAIVGVGAFIVMRKHNVNSTYQSVIQNFITAIQKNDKTTADSLESPAAKAYFQKISGTSSSFYDACQKVGLFCTSYFEQSFLAKATKTQKDYTAADGTKGKEVVYTKTEPLPGVQAGGPAGCVSSSTITLTFDAVPKGDSWLIDKFVMGAGPNGNLCPATGGSTSVGN